MGGQGLDLSGPGYGEMAESYEPSAQKKNSGSVLD
jgi:hypothetical protein